MEHQQDSGNVSTQENLEQIPTISNDKCETRTTTSQIGIVERFLADSNKYLKDN